MTKILRTKATDSLQSSNSFELKMAELEALFSSIGEGVIATDSKGRVSRVNEPALKILGYKASELMGKWYPETVRAEEESGQPIENIDRPITEVFITGKPVFKRVYYRRKNNERVAVALTVSPIMLENKPIGAIEVFRDITDEIKLEQAKDEFIAIASHQLRTPATSVKQYAGMLLAEYFGKLTEEQTTMLNKVYENNERQITIINDLLRVAQIDSGRMKLITVEAALNHLLKELIFAQHDKFVARNQKLIFKCPKEVVWAQVDLERFTMALENLIDNASKYTPEGKNITVVLTKKDELICIKIKDEGVGMPRVDIPRIFEKFTRLDNPLSVKVGGTGLGLYWVKKILDLHHATLKVESKPNSGSTFTVQLPATSLN